MKNPRAATATKTANSYNPKNMKTASAAADAADE